MNKSILKTSLSIAIIFLTTILCSNLYSQPRNRNFIREQIDKHGECRNVAITKYNGDLMLYGTNGYAANDCPDGLTDALDELNDDGEYIDDVQLTENGRWLILYGDNGLQYNDIPSKLEKILKEWNSDGEVITSVSFNDDGDWIAVSQDHFSSSSKDIQRWIKDGMDSYGKVWATCVTDDAIVVVYEEGFKTRGDIPSTLMSKLRSTDIDVYRLKIAGEAWFISDGKSDYDYNM